VALTASDDRTVGIPGAIWVVLVVNTLVYSAHRGSKLAVVLLGSELGASAWLISVLASVYAIVPMILAVMSGRWSDRFGVKTPLVVGTLLLGAALLVPGAWSSLESLMVAATLIGAGHILYQVSMQNAVGHLSTESTRTRNFAAYSLTVSLSAVLGPFAAGVTIEQFDYSAAFILLGATALTASCLLAVFRGRLPGRSRPTSRLERGAVLHLLAIPPLRKVIVVSAVVMAAYDLFSFYLPLHAREAGLSAASIGVILAFFGAAAVIVRIALPSLVARFGDERLLTVCLVLAAVSYAALPLAQDLVTLVIVSFLIGLTLGCGPALLVPMTYARAPEGCSGEALGLRLSASYGAHCAVPLMFAGVATAAGTVAILWSSSLMLVLGVLYLGHRSRSAILLDKPSTGIKLSPD